MSVPNERMKDAEFADPLDPRPEATLAPAHSGDVSTVSKLGHLFVGMRPHQWVKNGFLFAPLVFGHELFEPGLVLRSIAAFFFFSFIASAVYLGNDVLDVESDRLHPVK